MSKEHYVVNCYTCQHNGQETCKGCNTLLNGEDEPYQNWQLREDLEQKDNKISGLQSQLAEKEKEIERLKATIDFYKSYYISFKEKVIDELEKVKELMRSIDMPNKPELYNNDMFGAGFDSHYIRVKELIDNQIKQLKEMK